MTDLRDRLGDLVADVPDHVHIDTRAAWSAGARRRTAQGVGVLAAVLAALVITTGLLTWSPRSLVLEPAGDDSGVDGHPTRVEQPWHEPELPARPGPVAGLLIDGADGVHAVSRTGQVWRLEQSRRAAGYPLAISDDGRWIAYLRASDEFVVRDLVTGGVTEAEGVTDGVYDGATQTHGPGRFWVYSQSPAFWSPDSRRVLVEGSSPTSDAPSGALVIGVDGSVSEVIGPTTGRHAAAWPAGWTSDGDLVWLRGPFADRTRWAEAVVMTTTGRELRRIDLDVPAGAGGLSQMSGSVSPDGSRLSVVTGDVAMDEWVFSLQDGSLVGRVGTPADDLCPVSWAGADVRLSFAGSEVVAVRDDDGRPQVVVDPGFESSCVLWASDALAGSAHDGLAGRVFGSSDSWLSWHWREAMLGLSAAGAVVLAILLLVVLRRRRLGRTS